MENDNFYVDLVFNDEIQTSFDFNFFKNQITTKSWTDEEIAKYCDFPDFERYITIKNTYFIFKIVIFFFGFFDILLIGFFIFYFLKKKNTNKNINDKIELYPHNF